MTCLLESRIAEWKYRLPIDSYVILYNKEFQSLWFFLAISKEFCIIKKENAQKIPRPFRKNLSWDPLRNVSDRTLRKSDAVVESDPAATDDSRHVVPVVHVMH